MKRNVRLYFMASLAKFGLNRWARLARKAHYWIAIFCLLPLLVMTITGVLLLFKGTLDWVQPQTQTGISSGRPQVGLTEIFAQAQEVSQAQIGSWADIKRVEYRPSDGVIKLRSASGWELQFDHQTGRLLSSLKRRSDLIESIHDGTFFHRHAKLGVFLPVGLLLLVLIFSGSVLVIQKERSRRRPRSGRRLSSQA